MKTQDKTREELVELVQEQNLLIDTLEDRLFDERLFRRWVYPIISVGLITLTVVVIKFFEL